MALICGALEVGEIWTMWFGIVTDCAIGIVALEAISPMITLAWFDFTSFVAASTEAVACVCPSSEPTRVTLMRLREAVLLQRGIVQADGDLDGAVEVRPVGGEAARERQHVADPQVERAALRRLRRARRPGRPHCGGDGRRHAGDDGERDNSPLPHDSSLGGSARNAATLTGISFSCKARSILRRMAARNVATPVRPLVGFTTEAVC